MLSFSDGISDIFRYQKEQIKAELKILSVIILPSAQNSRTYSVFQIESPVPIVVEVVYLLLREWRRSGSADFI